MSYETIDHIRFNDTLDGVIILDQTALPGAERYLCLTTLEEMTEAICSLRVRGAPAIGIFAAFSLAALARRIPAESSVEILLRLRKDGAVLAASRPTAVNLSWAVQRMLDAAEPCAGLAPEDFRDHLYLEAQKILQEDIAMCRAIAGHGLTLLHDGDGILTHCNAGPIATSRYGTALGPILLAAEQGMQYDISPVQLRDAHPNTVIIEATGDSGKTVTVQAASVGGGSVMVQYLNGMEVGFSGSKTTLIIQHRDAPGAIAKVSRLLAASRTNIATMRVFREEAGGRAVMALELDSEPEEPHIDALRRVPGFESVTLLRV